MNISEFNYHLPPDLIAQFPLPHRSASRLLVLQKNTGHIQHKLFTDLSLLLNENDLLIFNNTKVIPARLFGVKTSGGKVEILVEKILSEQRILAQVKTSKTLKPGAKIILANNFELEFIARQDDLFELRVLSERPVLEILNVIGHIPLPPYIERADEKFDEERYQTVYATQEGAVAAPTAGLHFDENLLQQLKDKKIEFGFVTLHVGAGTFQPVRVENIAEHKMHAEYLEVSQEVCEKIKACKKRGGRVVAVGTTVVRALETAAQVGELKPYQGETSIFIYPGYSFKIIDTLITNFHLPKSTLLMLVCAFAGYDFMLTAYREAVKEKYRFFSYGDAMVIL